MSWQISDDFRIKKHCNTKGIDYSVDYRCILWNMTKNDAINSLNNCELDDKGTL